MADIRHRPLPWLANHGIRPDNFTGLSQASQRPRQISMIDIPWDQPATLIDLDGKPPSISTVRDCVRHYVILTPAAQQQARMLLTRPTFRADRKSRTWLLAPGEIELLVQRLMAENKKLN